NIRSRHIADNLLICSHFIGAESFSQVTVQINLIHQLYPSSYEFTTFTGFPSRYAFRLFTAMSISLCLDSFGAQEICGVMMQFFAFRRGLSPLIGSVDTTSRPAAATFPLFRASARSCSTIRGPLELFRMITPSFIFVMFSLLTIPSVSGNSGQCSAITSELASTSSNSAYLQFSFSSTGL